jgi:hypothetical protein
LRWCNADANSDSGGDSDGNAYSDCHSNAHTDANGYRDCHGYVHADAYSDANRGETLANAAAASNNTAAASVVRSGKWNSSCGNSRVTLASSPRDKSVAAGVPVFGAIPPCELIASRQTAVATLTVAVGTFRLRAPKKA